MSWGSLHFLYISTHRPDKALEAAERICDVWAKLNNDYPAESHYRVELVRAWLVFGNLLQAQSRSERAIEVYGQAIRTMQASPQKPQARARRRSCWALPTPCGRRY